MKLLPERVAKLPREMYSSNTPDPLRGRARDTGMTMENSGKTHASRAVIELRQRILSGDIPGGTRLFEVQLANEMKISRTPVRDAMSRLAEEGLLERARSSGFVVRSFSFSDVIDAIELRGVLEGTAARMAAERGVGDNALATAWAIIARLDACFGTTIGDVAFESYSELNSDFHREIAELSGSRLIRRELERVKQLPFASPSAFLPDKANIHAFHKSLTIAQEQHRAMIAAIAAREGTRAEAIAREHARMARMNLEFILLEDRGPISSHPGLALVVE